MKKLLLLPLISINLLAAAQNTLIPDANFEQALINLGYDNVIDGGLLTANISGLTTVSVNAQNISDLTGIEDFTALTSLDCGGNQLTSLDVSQNSALIGLYCNDNALTNLDVSQNTALNYLSCSVNQLTSLDVSQNTALTYLDCYNNQLTNVDVTQNTALDWLDCYNNQFTNIDVTQNNALEWLDCYNNQLTNIDVSQNTALTYLGCSENQLICLDVKNGNNSNLLIDADFNPSLTCIEVDDIAYSTANWTDIDPQTSFSLDCGNSCSGIAQDTCDYVDTTYVTVYDTTFVTIYDTVFVSVTDTLIIDISFTGVAPPNNTNTMLVYPNPASDVVIIDNGDYLSMNGYTLKIINSLGQEVFNSTINIPVFSIPVSTLGSVGTYYIQVFDTSPNIVQTKALIIQ